MKSEGRGTFCFFEPAMDAAVRERRALETDLRAALDAGALELHYQPIVDIASGETVACEALLRWDDPLRGPVSPSQFVSVAEESGLIGPLGAWVLRQACRDALAWPDAVRVSVNLSAAQFYGSDVPATVAAALAETGFPSNAGTRDHRKRPAAQQRGRLETLNRLRDLGPAIVMDGFGTGYSSLGYLRRFPFEKLKIDRSLVDPPAARRAPSSPPSSASASRWASR